MKNSAIPSLLSVAMALTCLGASNSQAAIQSLTDGGSTAYIDPDSAAGMYHWDLGFGGNQLNQQWFWYTIGNNLAQPINTISTASVNVVAPNWIESTYANAQISLTVTYKLTGGGVGTGTALIKETISVQNNSGGTINDFNLFQYSDFNLLGTPGGDSVAINGDLGSVIQNDGSTGIGEVITNPFANRAEAGVVNSTLLSLNTVPGYDLNNVLAAGPGDVAWAFQWIATTLNNGETLDIVKDKGIQLTVIPEPSTMALLALGLGVSGWFARRKA